MNKLMNVALWVIMDVMLFIVLLFTSIQFVVYNDSYFRWHYQQHGISEVTEMDIDNLMEVTDNMMDYLIDKRDSLDMTAVIDGTVSEVFGEREKAHMKDVKDLFLKGKQLRDLSAIILIVLFLYFSRIKKNLLAGWIKQLGTFFVTSFIVIGVFAAVVSTDFNKYFTIFHQIFFNNDLWLLDPETDILVNMVPEIFFFETVLLIAATFIISIVAVVVGSKLWGRYLDNKNTNSHK